MSATDQKGEFWGCKVYPGTPTCAIDHQQCMCARKNKKTAEQTKIIGHCKSGQNPKKRQNNIICRKNRENEKKKAKQEAKRQCVFPQTSRQKKADRKDKELGQTGDFSRENLSQQNSSKIRITKMGQKK